MAQIPLEQFGGGFARGFRRKMGKEGLDSKEHPFRLSSDKSREKGFWQQSVKTLIDPISHSHAMREFLNVVTHPRVYHPPVRVSVALQDLHRILDSPTLVPPQETQNHPDVMMSVIEEAGVSGNLIHDAHIAALCLEHGIAEFINGDRDFARFPSLPGRNPFA